jgi:hypothetical protein
MEASMIRMMLLLAGAGLVVIAWVLVTAWRRAQR